MNEQWVQEQFQSKTHRIDNLRDTGLAMYNGRIHDCREFMDLYIQKYNGMIYKTYYFPRVECDVSKNWIEELKLERV